MEVGVEVEGEGTYLRCYLKSGVIILANVMVKLDFISPFDLACKKSRLSFRKERPRDPEISSTPHSYKKIDKYLL